VRGSRAGIAGLLVAAVLAGCGSSSDDKTGLTSGQARSLVAQLEAARSSAAARNVAATEAAVDNFRASVARLRRAGALSDATARSLRVGAARVLQRVRDDNAPPQQPAAPPQTETTPAPAPPPPGQAKKKHDKEKHGKGKREKDD
jgi:hypothetical protein